MKKSWFFSLSVSLVSSDREKKREGERGKERKKETHDAKKEKKGEEKIVGLGDSLNSKYSETSYYLMSELRFCFLTPLTSQPQWLMEILLGAIHIIHHHPSRIW